MNVRFLALGAVLGFIIAAVPSCGGKACGPSNCAGCCGSDGKCVTTPNNGTNTTCGNAGNTCSNCTTSGTVCAAPAASPTAFACGTGGTGGGAGGGNAGCGPSTCVSGCCNGSVCVPQSAQTSASCGSSGAACSPCTGGQTCHSGSCGAAGVQIGDPCASDTDCSALGGTFKCKKMTSSGNGTYKNGYCTKICTAAADCPSATSACVGLGPAYGEADRFCWKKCPGGDSDCQGADGYACYNVTISGATTPVCWIDPIPAIDAGPPSDKIGNACTTDSNCVNPPDPQYGFCIPELFSPDGGVGTPTGYTGGECVADCSTAGNAICGTKGLCLGGYLGSTDVCVPKCAAAWAGQSDCRTTDYVCTGYIRTSADGGQMASTDGYCEPSCFATGAGCSDAGYCDAGYCLPKQ